MKTWLTGCALIGAFAVTGCGGTTPAGGDSPSVSAGTQEASPSGSSGGAAASSSPSGAASSETAQPGAAQTGTTASPDSSEATYELTKTYTDPDGRFTVKYPETWKAQENRGYLELTSPNGKVKGTVASTAAHAPDNGWFTRPVHPLVGDETGLSKQLHERVTTYSSYLPAPKRSHKEDSVIWGLTESNNRGLVALPGGGGKRNELWAEFAYAPVNEGNRPLPQHKGVELVNEINQTDEAGAVDAILKSIRVSG